MKEEQGFYRDFDNAERVGYLISCFIKGTLTPMERKELDEWILASDENELLFNELTSTENIQKTMQWYANLDEEKTMQRLRKRIVFKKERKRLLPLSFLTVAASLIIIASLAILFISRSGRSKVNEPQLTVFSSDIAAGSNKAILTDAVGNKIVLDKSAPASIEDGSIKIADGTITYESSVAMPPKENLLTVPKGGQYVIVLPDGSKVWLNAASSLRYMTAFVGSERRVVLTGEAYFEVAKNKEKPFIVESSGNEIKVLGTHFNVNSYGDENVFTTTLLEGSVQISRGSLSKILKPGQQARIGGEGIDIVPADTREATAWKEGEFVFRDAPVHSIVSQLARWYDVETEFKDPVEKHLNATIKRDLPLSKVLHYLEETGDVHFKTEGTKLIVMK